MRGIPSPTLVAAVLVLVAGLAATGVAATASASSSTVAAKKKKKKKPDLRVKKISGPEQAVEGSSARVSLKVKNAGRKRAPRSKAGVFLSDDERSDGGDVALGKVKIRALKGGAKARKRATIDIPRLRAHERVRRGSAGASGYFLLGCADAVGKVRESKERNNCRSSGETLHVSPGSETPPAPPPPAPTKPVLERVSVTEIDGVCAYFPGGAGGGTVHLQDPAPAGGVAVALQSTPALTVPPSVTVSPGKASAGFAIGSSSSGPATITATLGSSVKQVATSVGGCGESLIQFGWGEGCDDGGSVPGDGCSAACQIEPGWTCTGEPSVCSPTSVCGDGFVDPAEGCDDGNTSPGDGCSAACQIEPGFTCTGEPSVCSPI